jgi:hypothetical protein
LEGLGVDGRIILEWILRETGLEGVDWIQYSIGPSGGLL